MQGHGVKAVLLQVVGQAVTFNLGAGKNNGLIDTGVAQPMIQQFALVLGVIGPVQNLLDVDVFFLRIVDADALGFAHHAGGQLLNARRKGSAEHHGLLAVDGELVDFGQVIRKAQVQHAVGLVDHQKLHLVQFDLHGALQVQQATGRGHHQIGILQLGNLQLIRHTAHDIGNPQATAVLDQVDGIMRHLLSQLSGGADDQCARGRGFEIARVSRVLALGTLGRRFALGSGLGDCCFIGLALIGFGLRHLLEQGVQYRQQKRGGLTATGLTGDHQVDVFFCALVCALGR